MDPPEEKHGRDGGAPDGIKECFVTTIAKLGQTDNGRVPEFESERMPLDQIFFERISARSENGRQKRALILTRKF